jgi:hypothetical protein
MDLMPPNPAESPSPEQVLAVHRALAAAAIPHAIGGAVALAHYAEPRPTKDIDVNVFLPPDGRPEVERTLEPFEDRDQVHLFFSEDALHAAMPAAVREVPFAGATIPLIASEHLIVRKAMLDRPKDWLDIEAILVATEPLDVGEIRAWLRRLAGADDPRFAKLDALLNRLVL